MLALHLFNHFASWYNYKLRIAFNCIVVILFFVSFIIFDKFSFLGFLIAFLSFICVFKVLAFIRNKKYLEILKKQDPTTPSEKDFDLILIETFSLLMVKFNKEILEYIFPLLSDNEKIIVKNIIQIYSGCIGIFNNKNKLYLNIVPHRIRYVIEIKQQYEIMKLLKGIKATRRAYGNKQQ